MEYNLEHPLMRVWLPEGDNKYGHVSLQTNKYYMSFWPDKENKHGKDEHKSERAFKIKALSGVPGSINFHPDFDCNEEGNRFPDHKILITIAECSDMDELYEEFLVYNGIDREEVSLRKGCYIRKHNETVESRDRLAVNKSLGKTKYTFLPRLKHKNITPFYYGGQSCVSFVYHMIEWSKSVHSRKITFEFFGKLFEFLDLVAASFPIEPPKREVYVNVWMHTVDGRIVCGVERMLENQLTGELENVNSLKRRQTVTTEPLTVSYEVPFRVEQTGSWKLSEFGSIWEVPNFFKSFLSIDRNNEVYQYA